MLSNKNAQKVEDAYNVSSVWLKTGQGEMMLSDNGHGTALIKKQSVSTAGERLKQWRESNDITQKELAEKIGYKQVAISAAESGKEGRGVSRKMANKLEQEMKLSRIWLLEGIGNPTGINTDESHATTSTNNQPLNVVKHLLSASVNKGGEGNMALVTTKAKAGYAESLEDPEYVHELPPVRIPGFDEGVFRVFEVSGMSMHPTLFPDDLVICEKLDDPAEIRDDRVHVIVTKSEGVLIKRVLNRLNRSQKMDFNVR